VPKKHQFKDITTITKSNYAEVMSNYQRLVFHWLKKSKSPVQHWEAMSRQFWEQVWIDRKKFDRKKGRMTTWLGWKWMQFVYDAARAARLGYEEAPLTMGDYARLSKQQVATTSWGLNPAEQYDAQKRDDGMLIPIEEKKSLYALPDEPEEGKLGLRELISSMSEKDQNILLLLESCESHRKVADALGISHTAASNRVNAAKGRLLKLITGSKSGVKPKIFFSSRPDEYWDEFFRTLAQTTPLESNDWSHAEMTRTRNRWLRQRGR